MISSIPFCLMLSALGISLLCGAPVPSSGEETENAGGGLSSTIKLGGYHFDDSADFVHRSARLSGELRFAKNRAVEANFTRHWVSQEGDQFTGSGAELLLVDTFRPGLEGKLGMGLVSHGGLGTDVCWLASLGIQPTETSHLTLSYEHANVAYEVNTLDALKAGIRSDKFSPSFYQWFSESWSFWGRFSLGRYSDRNLRTSVDASLTYLLRPEPEFGLSYAFGYLNYRNRSERYWDPIGYLGHYLILHMKQNMGDLVSFNLRGSIGFSPSEKRVNSSVSIGIALRHLPHWGLDLSGEYLGEPGRGENYSCTSSSVSIAWVP